MQRLLVAPAIVVAVLALSPFARAQNAPPAQGRGGAGRGAGGAAAAAGAGAGRGAAAAPRDPTKENENIHIDGWNRPQQSLEATGKKPGPAPMRDLSGIWEPT